MACYTTGHFASGTMTRDVTSGRDCPMTRPQTDTWHNLKVFVGESTAAFYLDDELILEGQQIHHALYAVGGVFIPDGFGILASFKNMKILIMS